MSRASPNARTAGKGSRARGRGPRRPRRIRSLLVEAEDVEVIAECANGREAIQAIEEWPPDLLFLDIQMPEIDGFDVLQAIGVGRVPVVIFVTAYDQFALRAFEAHALDYPLKPFDDERFAAALAAAAGRSGWRARGGAATSAPAARAVRGAVRGGAAAPARPDPPAAAGRRSGPPAAGVAGDGARRS